VSEAKNRPGRDVILIGGSAGAIEALLKIAKTLPPDFPASILVVVHTSAESPGMLPRVLERGGRLPASHAEDGERIRGGHIYVAPPDHHLLLGENEMMRVRKGPRENGHRPAIDPLFRSAMAHGYGPRVVAVVLSGYLDDGSAGLFAVRSRGGVAVVQDPADAIAPHMPTNALHYAGADYVVPASDIGDKLVELAGRVQKVIPMTSKKTNIEAQRKRGAKVLEEHPMANQLTAFPEDSVGTPSVFACPECHGVLWEIKEGGVVRYRCRVGHGYSEVTLNEELSQAAESALWAAMRALDEKASMTRRMAETATGPQRWTARLREQADTYASHAEMLRTIILGEPEEAAKREQGGKTEQTA
jgi:two-component system, chemotaxis family, protein-glutamate methylesterase/glutaminase